MNDKLRVAIVDDTPDMRLLVRLSLELDPHIDVVAEAADGRGAIEVAEQHHPDVMLLDLAMPVMDGMQALPQVVRTSPETVVLVLSGFAAATMADDAVAAGAAGYLQKGIGAEELCERVWEASGRERPAPFEDLFALPTEATPVEAPPDDVAARAAESAPAPVLLVGMTAPSPSQWVLRYGNAEARRLLGLTAGQVGRPLGEVMPVLADVLGRLVASGTDAAEPLGALQVRARKVEGRRDEVAVVLWA